MTTTTTTTNKSAAHKRWLKRRRIGASDAATIMNASPSKSAYTLYLEKRGEIEPHDFSDNLFVELGHALEPSLRAWAKRKLYPGKRGAGWVWNPGRYSIQYHEDHDFMSATLDGVLCYPSPEICDLFRLPEWEEDDPGAGVLELKVSWRPGVWEEGLPEYYWIQVQHQLAVTGYKWGILLALVNESHNPSVQLHPILRSNPYIERMIERERIFWQRVRSGDPPPVDASDSCRVALGKQYKEAPEEPAVELGPQSVEWDRFLTAAKVDQERAETSRRLYENKLKEAIGSASVATLPNGVRYSWRTQTRGDATFRVLRRVRAAPPQDPCMEATSYADL